MPGFMILAFIIFVGAVMYHGYVYNYNKKRREALTLLAAQLGLSYESDIDDTRLGGRYDQIDLLRNGDNRYTENHLVGKIDGRPVVVCDFHYETYTTDNKGRRQTNDHYYGIIFIDIPLRMSQVCIREENLFDKLAGILGFEDIDFESAEFSRRFHVSAEQPKFAYDLIHPRAMEYLLAQEGYSWEFDGRTIAMYKSARFDPEEIQPAINTAMGFIPLIPEYVLAERGPNNAAEK